MTNELLNSETMAGTDPETNDPAVLIHRTLDDAETATQAIVEAALTLGAWYRSADVSAANQALPSFAEGLGMLIVVTNTVAETAGVDLSTSRDDAPSAMQTINALIAHSDALLSAQRAADWARVADIIESDIASAVRRWPSVLQGIRLASPALAGAL